MTEAVEAKRVDAMRASRTFSKMKFRHTSYSEFMGDTFLTSQVGDMWAVVEQYLKALSSELQTIKSEMPQEELEGVKLALQVPALTETLTLGYSEAVEASGGKLSSIEIATSILQAAYEAQSKGNVGKGAKDGGKQKDLS